jgi:hypothetical protein
MDASQLLRIRMEQAPKIIPRSKPVDASFLTYQRMITANATCRCDTPQPPIPLETGVKYEGCTIPGSNKCVFLQKEGHLRMGSSGSGSKVYSGDVALKNAGNAQYSTPGVQNGQLYITISGCCDADAGYYGEPGRYDPLRPDDRLLLKKAPCGNCIDNKRYVGPECCSDPGHVDSLPAGCNNCCKGVVVNY